MTRPWLAALCCQDTCPHAARPPPGRFQTTCQPSQGTQTAETLQLFYLNKKKKKVPSHTENKSNNRKEFRVALPALCALQGAAHSGHMGPSPAHRPRSHTAQRTDLAPGTTKLLTSVRSTWRPLLSTYPVRWPHCGQGDRCVWLFLLLTVTEFITRAIAWGQGSLHLCLRPLSPVPPDVPGGVARPLVCGFGPISLWSSLSGRQTPHGGVWTESGGGTWFRPSKGLPPPLPTEQCGRG